jgi:hypothetical protein
MEDYIKFQPHIDFFICKLYEMNELPIYYLQKNSAFTLR